MGSTQELLARIRELEIENMELKSKLDQYQSVFKVDSPTPTPGSGSGQAEPRARRTNRGVGISAEPQSLKTMSELTNQTFPEFKKSDR
jgi:hypothetical protein